MEIKQQPLGSTKEFGDVLQELAATIDSRVGANPGSSWTAKLLAAGPEACAKKLGEEGVEAALAVASQTDEAVAAEAADVIYHLLVAMRSRGVTASDVADVLKSRQARSGLEEKASRRD